MGKLNTESIKYIQEIMKNRNSYSKLSFLLFIFFYSFKLYSQFSFTSQGSVYNQSFDSFSGTSVTVPQYWTYSGTDYTPGGYYTRAESYSNANSTYGLRDNTISTDIAFGAKVGASEGPFTLTFSAINNTPGKITNISISWNAEQFSRGGRATSLSFSSPTGGTITGSGLSAFTAITGTDANLSSVNSTSKSVSISGLDISKNSTFSFVWTFTTGSGSGNNGHIGLDDVQITIVTILPISLASFTAQPLPTGLTHHE